MATERDTTMVNPSVRFLPNTLRTLLGLSIVTPQQLANHLLKKEKNTEGREESVWLRGVMLEIMNSTTKEKEGLFVEYGVHSDGNITVSYIISCPDGTMTDECLDHINILKIKFGIKLST